MSDSSVSQSEPVVVQLVDTHSGRAVQTWKFGARTTITVGRAPDQDISLTDPYVSRHHADLRFHEGHWTLVALSKNGVLVNGRNVAEAQLEDGVAFRLGTSGPVLRFARDEQSFRELPTLAGAELPAELRLDLNTAKLDDEVRGITESEYFQELQKQARTMRQQRDNK